ncbi:MAG: hypothetical protein JSU96_08355, partial [Acidobacteriota bacterium]
VKLKNIARSYRIQGDPDSFYDKPIAVLTGPGALSSGDQVALRMRFHPNSRFFGKPTAAAFNSPKDLDLDEFEGQWTGRYAAADAVLTRDLDRSLTRTPLKVDQDIWLRPEDVRQGRDTVVQAAMDWIHGVTLPKRLHFTHFGDGAGVLRSRLLLLSQSPDTPVAGRLKLRDDQGDPLETDFAGHQLRGQLEVKVAPMQPWVESSDGTGDVRSGSLTIWMDGALDGVLLYGGPIGLAGIPPSPVLERGFLAPILEDELQDIASAVAISNATDKETEITLELLDASGHPLANASLTLPSFGHVALYAHEFGWSQPVDLSRFLGVIRASYSGAVVAVALQTRPGELAALPVTERLGNESAPSENTSDAEVHELYFPHFGDGRGLLSSQILLLNPSSETARDIEVILTNDHGDPLTVDLNGTVIEGSVAVEIPPNGISSLQTDGIGSTIAGSVRIVSSSPVTGVVLFGGPTGVAGVGSSRAVSSGFLAPVEIKEEGNPFAATNYIIRTGIALRNLESDREVSLTLHLRNLAGKLLNTTSLVLPPGGHLARYLDELDWDRIFFHSELLGLLEVDSAGDRIAAIILRSEPGQLATFPVVPVLGSVVTDVQEIGTSGER